MPRKSKSKPIVGSLQVAGHTVRMDISSSVGTPGIAALIGKVLRQHGATVESRSLVVFSDMAGMERKGFKPDLRGLNVIIDRVTWVRPEETERWGYNTTTIRWSAQQPVAAAIKPAKKKR